MHLDHMFTAGAEHVQMHASIKPLGCLLKIPSLTPSNTLASIFLLRTQSVVHGCCLMIAKGKSSTDIHLHFFSARRDIMSIAGQKFFGIVQSMHTEGSSYKLSLLSLLDTSRSMQTSILILHVSAGLFCGSKQCVGILPAGP